MRNLTKLIFLGLGLALIAATKSIKDKTVLIVGDSISVGKNSFGGLLEKKIKEGGAASVTRVAIGGMSALSMREKRLYQTAIKKEYDLCFILLGTNDAANLAVGADPKKTIEAFGKMVDEIKADRFIGSGSQAFGPSASRKYPGIDDKAKTLNAAIEPVFDTFISLFDLTTLPEFKESFRTKDGVHFTKEGSEFLATEFMERL